MLLEPFAAFAGSHNEVECRDFGPDGRGVVWVDFDHHVHETVKVADYFVDVVDAVHSSEVVNFGSLC